MHLNDYQTQAVETAIYKHPILYTSLKLAGEAGEVAEKVGKLLRDTDVDITNVKACISDHERFELAKELGDVLWYIANLAHDLDLPLAQVANMNLNKLKDRVKRGVLHGNGDNR